MTPEQENVCRQALDEMKTISLTDPFPYGSDDLSSVLHQHGLHMASINLLQKTATGFTGAGCDAVTTLAKTFRPSLSQNSRLVSNPTLAKLIADEIMKEWIDRKSSSLAEPDFDWLQATIDNWYSTLTQVREHLVPCTLYPYAIPSFAVGPVTFRHVSKLPTEDFGSSHEEFAPGWKQWFWGVRAAVQGKPNKRTEVGGFQFSNLVRFMNERAASWVAFVKVTGRPPKEAIRAADLSTDIALAAIQLLSPGADMRTINRASARAAPVWRVDVSLTEGGGFSEGMSNQSPALARPS